MTTIITGAQNRFKDSYAYSPEIGLALRSNGEEKVKIIDDLGNVFNAAVASPTVAPTVAQSSAGALPVGSWVCYVYVYASEGKFPLVENIVAINGSIAPRSNPSPISLPFQVITTDSRVNVTVTKTTDSIINKIWIFRTELLSSSAEATTAAAAGQLFYLGQVANNGVAGTVVYEDNSLVTTDQIEQDNYASPQFQFCVYVDPYFWGFGNFGFAGIGNWFAASSALQLTDGQTWFDGRDGEFVKLQGVVSGGIDGKGTFIFKWLSSNQMRLTLADGSNAPISDGSGTIMVQGPAATLYRSKFRNPFSWGETNLVGTAQIPSQFGIKVGGGFGTAIALVPDQTLLKLDLEQPARCYTFNLQAAGTDSFEGTRRLVSSIYSVSSHWSQFSSVNKEGRSILRGMDFKNFSIVESDGMVQIPVSNPIPLIMRNLTRIRSRQLLCHGLYDPFTELNCLWVASEDSVNYCNLLIFEHAPTGFWGVVQENDVLASGSIEDPLDSRRKTFVGTQSGLMGQAFVDNLFSNWLPPSGTFAGVISAATPTSITITGGAFNITNDGMIGNWVLITDSVGGTEQLARISARTSTTLTFDLFKSYFGGFSNQFSPTPAVGSKFYIGIIEVRLLKYFDLQLPSTDKRISEIWITAQNAATAETLLRFYRNREILAFATIANLQKVKNTPDSEGSDVLYTKTQALPTWLKTFGLEIINRGYSNFKLNNLTIKVDVNP